MEEQEQFANRIRTAGKQMQEAEEEIAVAEGKEKMVYATAMVMAEGEGHKTAAAQMRFADLSGEVDNAPINRGVAKGQLAAAKATFRAYEINFETWRPKSASNRLQQMVYRG